MMLLAVLVGRRRPAVDRPHVPAARRLAVGFVVRVLVNAAAIWLASRIVPGISADGAGHILVAGLVLGLINALVRPVLVILTFPLTLLTLGLFLLVLNAFCLVMTSWLVRAARGRLLARGAGRPGGLGGELGADRLRQRQRPAGAHALTRPPGGRARGRERRAPVFRPPGHPLR